MLMTANQIVAYRLEGTGLVQGGIGGPTTQFAAQYVPQFLLSLVAANADTIEHNVEVFLIAPDTTVSWLGVVNLPAPTGTNDHASVDLMQALALGIGVGFAVPPGFVLGFRMVEDFVTASCGVNAVYGVA